MAFSQQPSRAYGQHTPEFLSRQTSFSTFALQQFHYTNPFVVQGDKEVEVQVSQAIFKGESSVEAGLFLRTAFDGKVVANAAAADIAVVVPASLNSDMEYIASKAIEIIATSLKKQDRIAMVVCEDSPLVALPLATVDKSWSMDNVHVLLRVTTTDEANDEQNAKALLQQGVRRAVQLLVDANQSSKSPRMKRVVVLSIDQPRPQIPHLMSVASNGAVVWKNIPVVAKSTNTVNLPTEQNELLQLISSAQKESNVYVSWVAVNQDVTSDEFMRVAKIPGCNVLGVQSTNAEVVLSEQLPYLLHPVAHGAKLRVETEGLRIRNVHGIGGLSNMDGGMAELDLELGALFASPSKFNSAQGGVIVLEMDLNNERKPSLTIALDYTNLLGRRRHHSFSLDVRTTTLSPVASWVVLNDEFDELSNSSRPPQLPAEYFEDDSIKKAHFLLRCARTLSHWSDEIAAVQSTARARMALPVEADRMQQNRFGVLLPAQTVGSMPCSPPGFAWLRQTIERMHAQSEPESTSPLPWLHRIGSLVTRAVSGANACYAPTARDSLQSESSVCSRLACTCGNAGHARIVRAAQKLSHDLLELETSTQSNVSLPFNARPDTELAEFRDKLQLLRLLCVAKQNWLYPTGTITVPPCLCMYQPQESAIADPANDISSYDRRMFCPMMSGIDDSPHEELPAQCPDPQFDSYHDRSDFLGVHYS